MNQPSAPRTSSRWPTGTEYAAAVQQPTTSFADSELQQGQLTLTPLGIPASASGQNAIAFHMEAAERPVAVRCLLSAHDDGRLRYRALQEHVDAFDVPSVVAATWLDEGVRVHGRWWPVVVMPWVSGDPLHIAVEDRLGDPRRLSRLADRWLDLVETLQDKEFAHGDYQHGNVLLTDDDDFQLVDLDGIWVPGMGVGPPNEYGHPNYQHVNRSDTDWGPYVDTFSALVIALSMLALAADPGLARFMTGENLLFAKPDFEAPDRAEIWRALAASDDPEVVDLTARLHAMACAGRQPALSVREVLDASFDPSSLATVVEEHEVTGGLPNVSAGASEDWWSGAAPVPPSNPDSFWRGGTEPDVAASQPSAPGAPGYVPAVTPVAPVQPVGHAGVQYQPAAVVTAAGSPQSQGLARITGQPVLAGLVSGALAGLLGSLIAGLLQGAMADAQLDGGLFVGMIAGMLGGLVHSWSALNLSNYALAARRFLIGAAVGLLAGIVAVFVADFMTRSTLEVGDTENAVLVAYIWALTAALVGLAAGLLHSPKAGVYAFSGGAVAGFVGGMVHGLTSARFEARALQVNGFDGQVLLTASFVAMLIGVLVAVAIRTARNGSLTVVEGPGQGTVIDFHSNRITLGGSSGDTLVVTGRGLRPRAIELAIGDHVADVTTTVEVVVDGVPQPARFRLASGQVMAFAGLFVRLDIKSDAARGGPVMSRQRLVAALAAMAIGFGVTLVGVQLVDDDTDAVVVTAVEPESPTSEPEADAADEAQQEAAPAEPPPDADVVEDVDVTEDVDVADDVDDIDDGEAPVATSGGQTPPRTGEDERDSTDDADCEAVLVVRTGSGQLLILSSELGEFIESDGRFFLTVSGDSIADRFRTQDIELISGIVDDRPTSRSVQDCETGEVVEATILVGAGDDVSDAESAGDFPCSDDAFDALFDELDVLEATALVDEADIFVRVVAKSLAQFGGASVDDWETQIEEVFDDFVDPDECVDALDDIFVRGGSDGFFCASANVSADPRLFDYLASVVPDQMSRCTYFHGEGVN